jgi:hypothetical protein
VEASLAPCRQTVPCGLGELFDVVEDGLLRRSSSRFDEIVGRAKHEGVSVAREELEVVQDGSSLVEGCSVEEVIGDVARPMDAVGLAPLGGEAPVLEGWEARDQCRGEGLPQRVDVGHIHATGNGKKDREQCEVRVRVIKLETRAARWLGRRGIGARSARGGRTGRRGARYLIRLGAWEEGEQEFLASGRWRTNESNEPLVDSGAVVRTVLGQGHDVGVVEGVDNTSADRFLGFRNRRKRHLIDVACVDEREALVGVGVVQNGTADG